MSRSIDSPKSRSDNIENRNATTLDSLDASVVPAAAEAGRGIDAYFDHHGSKPAPRGWADVEPLDVKFPERQVEPKNPRNPEETLSRREQLAQVLDEGITPTIGYEPALAAAFGPARERGLLAQQEGDTTPAEAWGQARRLFGGEVKRLCEDGHAIPVIGKVERLRADGQNVTDIKGWEGHHGVFTKPEYPQHLLNPEMLRLCPPDKLPGVGSEKDAHKQFHEIDGVEGNVNGKMACDPLSDSAVEQVMRERAFRAPSDRVPLHEVAETVRKATEEYGDRHGYAEKDYERTVVIDTETTGFSPAKGDKIVEIGAVELLDGVVSGRTFHTLLDPERHLPSKVAQIHGIDDAKVNGMPTFGEKAEDFVAFLGDSNIVAHNAKFDMRFVNSELENAGLPTIDPARVVDTLPLAQKLHPGEKNNLDALSERYGVYDRRSQAGNVHGALTDAKILGDLYGKLDEATRLRRKPEEEGE